MTAAPAGPRRLLRLLLRLYPKEFRDSFADDLLSTLDDRHEHGATDGVRIPARRELWALMRSVLSLRIRQLVRAGAHAMRSPLRLYQETTMDSLWQDIRYAARNLSRTPSFTIVAVLTLALGIGATTTIFSVIDAVLLRPLPYRDPPTVVTIWSSWIDFPKTWVSRSEFQYYRRNSNTLSDVGLYQKASLTITDDDTPVRVTIGVLTSNALSVLGVEPIIGRVFTHEEVVTNANVILIGHDLWQRRYGGEPSVLGSTLELGGAPQVVIGVMPPGFQLPLDYVDGRRTQVWGRLPLELDGDGTVNFQGGAHQFYGIARLAPGSTVEQVRAELTGMSRALEAEGVYPASWNFRPLVFAVSRDVLGSARPAILVLAGTVAFVLLIACANVANLFLTRAQGRQRELAVRAALGAGRSHLLRQLLVESAVLASAGGALGLFLAWASLQGLMAYDPGSIPRLEGVDINAGVIAFTLVVTAATTLVFGALPGLQSSKPNLVGTLREGDRGSTETRERKRVRAALVGAQIALSVVLVTGTGLMIKSFSRLVAIDPGFRPEEVLTFGASASATFYPELRDQVRFFDDLLAALQASPEIRIAAATSSLPLVHQLGNMPVVVEGLEDVPEGGTWGDWQVVTPGFFEAMGFQLIAGRFFDEREAFPDTTNLSIIINESMARAYWPGRNPIGGRMTTGGGSWLTVVGVVGDVRHDGLTAEVGPAWYRPVAQFALDAGFLPRGLVVVVSTQATARAVTGTVRTIAQQVDPRLAVSGLRTTDDVYAAALAQPRFTMLMLGTFALLALTLATIGVYGVIAYTVGQRRGEIGIRMALGAGRGRIVTEFLRGGLGVVLLGVTVGSVAALLLTQFMRGFLYGVSVRDPVTFLTVPTALLVVALIATYVPATRAARIDPAMALRIE